MPQKAQDLINHGVADIKHAIQDLQSAINIAEKPANKAQIQKAIDDINCACNHLANYKD